MRGWGADANTVDRNQYEDSSSQHHNQPQRLQRDHQQYQSQYQRTSESFQHPHPGSRERYHSQNHFDSNNKNGRRSESYSNDRGEPRGYSARKDRQVSHGAGGGGGERGWYSPGDDHQHSETQQQDQTTSNVPFSEEPRYHSRPDTRQSTGPPGVLSPTRVREGGILHAVELGHRGEASKGGMKVAEKAREDDGMRSIGTRADEEERIDRQSAETAGYSEPNIVTTDQETKIGRPPGLPSPTEDCNIASPEPSASDANGNSGPPDNESDEARLAAEIWGAPSTSTLPPPHINVQPFPPGPARHSPYSNVRWNTENRPYQSNRSAGQYQTQPGAGARFHNNRREEYKAEIRDKIERLEDEEKPAFVKATKEKERGEKGDERWGNTGGSDGWGILDGGQVVHGGRPDLNPRGWSNGGEEMYQGQQAGPGRSGWNGPSAGHRLQGDVSRRIPDAGWGPRGRGSRRGSGKFLARGEERSETSSIGYHGVSEPSGPASTRGDQTSRRSDKTEEGEQQASTPRQSQKAVELMEETIESVVVEPSERIAATPAPSTPNPQSSSPPQQAHQPTSSGFSAHTRLITMAVNELRPPPTETLTSQQLKRFGHKQDRVDYVADWKRSQAAEPSGETREWDEAKSLSSESQSMSVYKKGRGKTKAPAVSGSASVIVALPPSVGKKRTLRDRADDRLRQTGDEGSETSTQSREGAKMEEDPVTIRGTSFDGIWDTVPIDSEASLKSAGQEPSPEERGNHDVTPNAGLKESKIVVRLPTPRSSPLPSLAGSEHVASPLLEAAILQEPGDQEVPATVPSERVPSSMVKSVLGLLTDMREAHRRSNTVESQKTEKDQSPAETVTADTKLPTPIVAVPQGGLDGVIRRSAAFHSAPSGAKAIPAASATLPRPHSSLGSIPLEKVIIPLDDLSDVESVTESELVASSRNPLQNLPEIPPAIVTTEAHPAGTSHYFRRQPGIRSAVIPERRLPGLTSEASNHSPLYSHHDIHTSNLSRPPIHTNDGNDWRSASNYNSGASKWEIRMENLLHSVAARQGGLESTQHELRALRQENASLQHHLQEARQRAYASQTAVAEKQSHVDQLNTRIGENARTAQMYEGPLAARNADLAYCRGRIEHLEGILLVNQKFITELQTKLSEGSLVKKTDKTEDRFRSAIDRTVESSKSVLEQGRRTEQNLTSQIEKLQQSLQSKMLTEADLERKLETQAANLKERGLVLDVREANFQLAQVEKERDYYKRLAQNYHDQLKQRSSDPTTVFDLDPHSDGFIETTYNSPSPDRQRISSSGMPNTPPMSGLMTNPLGKSETRL